MRNASLSFAGMIFKRTKGQVVLDTITFQDLCHALAFSLGNFLMQLSGEDLNSSAASQFTGSISCATPRYLKELRKIGVFALS